MSKDEGEAAEPTRRPGDAAGRAPTGSTNSATGEQETDGLTHAELSARVLHLSSRSRNVEEPLGTAQWPTGQLSDKETKLLAAAIRRRRAA